MNNEGSIPATGGVAEARPLRIGDVAPDFQARTTKGEIRLSDFRGRWLLFFSHPADFTPVCTSEFMALAQAQDRFDALDCALLGLSVDSLYAHLAWLETIQERFGVEIPFPLVEDPSMVVCRAYGMLDQTARNSATVRACYVIDPDGVIRAVMWYPMSVGRSVEELLRLVEALRRSDGNAVMTPEGWKPGGDVVRPVPTTQAGVRKAEGTCWFYNTVPDTGRTRTR
ncbi:MULTISPECIES: peroxiredoxin [Komagataeibacter]|uniref:Thioredoxin peroxidase n=2 Tax=Komagataeibacter TaxID=1434011 RepID=A0A318QSP6_9PROT|nr:MULTISPECIES: peroxiredoxin [Komagataeibacter]GBR32978.1 peroxiredoxin [Komagataeibacter oboediens DSM 11826]MBL7234686.1 peroxiredoxin [Komagataeibacter oboediens]MBT0676383.1 peroxiredoxin [Komagataeibacter oboediens]MBT0679515.1 peroxiredoxin [Komagataeibacter oboediens]MBV0888281.1 peroxiredoxin [Komagataeibacter oboediens]